MLQVRACWHLDDDPATRQRRAAVGSRPASGRDADAVGEVPQQLSAADAVRTSALAVYVLKGVISTASASRHSAAPCSEFGNVQASRLSPAAKAFGTPASTFDNIYGRSVSTEKRTGRAMVATSACQSNIHLG